MGAKLSKRRHAAHHGPAPTLDQDAAIGGTGGAVTGFVSGVGFLFINHLHEAVGLRASLSVVGLCVVGGAIVGALVCVAGTLVVKSLAWLYRQLRKRARRRTLEIQLNVFRQQSAAVAPTNSSTPTAVATAVGVPAPVLAGRQAALAQAREERARALAELAQYDRLLEEAEAQLQHALSSVASSSPSSFATAVEVDVQQQHQQQTVEEEEARSDADEQGEVEQETHEGGPASVQAPVVVVPPAQFFQPTPLHITLRLRESSDDGSDDFDGTNASEEDATDDDEYLLVDRLEEGHQRLIRRVMAVGGGGSHAEEGRSPRVGTPPIY